MGREGKGRECVWQWREEGNSCCTHRLQPRTWQGIVFQGNKGEKWYLFFSQLIFAEFLLQVGNSSPHLGFHFQGTELNFFWFPTTCGDFCGDNFACFVLNVGMLSPHLGISFQKSELIFAGFILQVETLSPHLGIYFQGSELNFSWFTTKCDSY